MQQFLTAAAFICLVGGFCNCTTPRQLTARAAKDLLADTALRQAHIGISLYDPATGRYLYNHQGDKYFIPASNIKLFTCYVGMKYLGDSLQGLQYWQNDTAIWLLPTGDPTLLHPDFERHPVLEFLQRQTKPLYLLPGNWRTNALGHGWAWDDYSSEYMVERSPLPVHGNMAVYQWRNTYPSAQGKGQRTWRIQPDYFTTQLDTTGVLESTAGIFDLQRQRMGNRVGATWRADSFDRAEIPVYTDTINTALAVLRYRYLPQIQKWDHSVYHSLPQNVPPTGLLPLKSQPTDSMLRPMMHRSDNFYAEQTLLMVSHERLGRMNEMALIDTLLKTDLVDLPQRPKWVDGSGLSRYNLATPQSLVQLLQKMSREFGLERLKTILPTGGKGTIGRYYQNLQGRIFAKTGTLSNNCALSGYLHTKSGKWLIFSVLANHYPAGATPVRRAVERFLNKVWQQY